MDIVLLILGLAGLLFGTEVTIKVAVSIAKRYRVSEFVIGLVVLSIGSDLPELSIAIDAGLKNLAGGSYSDVVVGSALGRVFLPTRHRGRSRWFRETSLCPAGGDYVVWVGHSTVLLRVGGVTILTDPVWSDRVSPVRWVRPR